MTGGGTDDTSVLQTALSASYAGGLVLVIDGVSLITGLDVGSNTTIQFLANCGFYLASSSNREAIRNVNRSATVITDTNITLTGLGKINGNKAGQSGVSQSDNTPMCAVAFYGISNLTINGGLTVYDSAAFEISIGNFSNVICDSLNLTATATNSNLNTDGIDLRGPGTNATLSNLTILAGDDSIALNSRNYGSSVIGPYIGGGDIMNVTIENLILQGSLLGIDLISDGTFKVSDIQISNLSGTVQNYALYLNLDTFNTPAGNGNFQNILLNGSTVTQVGSPFGGGIPTGLYVIGATTSGFQIANISPLPETLNLSATAAVVTGLQIGSGSTFNANGPLLVNLQGTTFVQSATGDNAAALQASFLSPLTSGSWILAFVLAFPGASVNLTGFSDTVNTYTLVATGSTGASNCYLYQVKKNISSSALTVTASFDTTPDVAVIGVLEYIGQAPNPVDVVSALLTATSTSYSANPVTTTGANATVIGLGYYNATSTFTAVSPAILRVFVASTLGAEDILAATAGTYTPETTSGSATFAWFTLAGFGQNPSIPAPNPPSFTGYGGGLTVRQLTQDNLKQALYWTLMKRANRGRH